MINFSSPTFIFFFRFKVKKYPSNERVNRIHKLNSNNSTILPMGNENNDNDDDKTHWQRQRHGETRNDGMVQHHLKSRMMTSNANLAK